MMKELVYAQAEALAGVLEERQKALLKLLCAAAVTTLEGQLRDGLTAQDCGDAFITAASLLALSGLGGTDGQIQEFRAGDLMVKQGGGGDAASRGLKQQAEGILAPYLKDRFSFLGV